MFSKAVCEVSIASGPVANAAGGAASSPPRPTAWTEDSLIPAVIALHASRSAPTGTDGQLGNSQPVS